MANLDQLIATVKQQMQPDGRAMATASTLQQLSSLMPTDATLADLIAGWHILARPASEQEPVNIERRRATCGELATMASSLTVEQGQLAHAIETWQAWRDHFASYASRGQFDPRVAAMTETFARELSELKAKF